MAKMPAFLQLGDTVQAMKKAKLAGVGEGTHICFAYVIRSTQFCKVCTAILNLQMNALSLKKTKWLGQGI